MQEKALVTHLELHKKVVKTPGYSVARAARSL